MKARLGMQIVVRIEAYDTTSFAFNVTPDLDWVMNKYTTLIQYVSSSANRGKVAYFALNMPVDDGAVQTRLGGINSATSKSRQPTYATNFVSRMKTVENAAGFTTALNYLSIFYGWDNTYELPSYAPANANGYFINNYSYPAGAPLDETVSDSALINQPRLQTAMNLFTGTYGTAAKFVMEYGFHTVEYNGGVIPNQTAGIVQNLLAKNKALKATTNYYKTTFTGARGTLYFGYNLFKNEGNPPATMDWALAYPVTGTREAESGTMTGSAAIYNDSAASGGMGVSGLNAANDSLSFYNQKAGNSLQIRYACQIAGKLSLYIDGTFNQSVSFPATGAWTGVYATKTVTVTIPSGASVKLQFNTGDLATNLDYILVP